VENSIDAESTFISIECINGGLKEITIKDNGLGIQIEDFPMLCERFATSKLHNIEELKDIASCGFRGEALASISFVSHLKISSKRKDQPFGYSGLVSKF
jgi:DNA mismatch repair protein MLH1